MGVAPNWTPEEIEYLQEAWGNTAVPTIAKRLGRSEQAVAQKAQKIGMPPFLESGDYITLNQLIKAVTGLGQGYTYHMTSWVEKRGLPVHHKRNRRCTWRVVYLNEFWEWAEKNRAFIDFSRMEPLILGKEPDWVADQRRKDYQSHSLQRKDVWMPSEEATLRHLLKQQKYGYAELAKRLGRSVGAIQRRIRDLHLKERPVKADNQRRWSAEDYKLLANGIMAGESYAAIGNIMGRSEKAVRGKVFCVYLTEDADKVRKMLAGDQWGHGAPIPTVKQALNLSAHRASVLSDISKLAGLIAAKRNEGWNPYWQKDMCLHWSEIHGCTKDQKNCDECVEFTRIPPQYCVRCGATFIERQKNRYCPKCRAARKKQAQRKWAICRKRGILIEPEDENTAAF